jgi:hypothetical protein
MLTKRRMRIAMIAVAALTLAALACTCGSLTGTGAGSGPNEFDGGDGLDTTGGGELTVGGGAQSATLNDLYEAHNWVFDGQAGQSVTIHVNAQGDADPRAKLLDPDGNVIAEDDDGGGGYNSLITATLPETGTYTVRVDVFSEGAYSVSVD